MNLDPVHILEHAGVKPTSNRLLVLKTLLSTKFPLSLIEIETMLQTLERSSILRVLTLLHEHDIIHSLEDGRGVVRYEVCHGEDYCSVDDMHPHFFCEKCGRVFCFEDISIPVLPIDNSFIVSSVNFMLKGLCPSCSGR